MPDTKVSALTDGTTANSTDRIPVARDAGGGTFNNRYVTPGYIGTTLLGSGTALTGSTVTTSSPVLNLTQTWNAGAVTFTGLKFNVTNTASAAGSKVLDLQINGVSYWAFQNKDAGGNTTPGLFFGDATQGRALLRTVSAGLLFSRSDGANDYFTMRTTNAPGSLAGIGFAPGAYLGWDSGSGGAGTLDLMLTRGGVATLQLGAADAAAPVAQFFKVQSVVGSTPGATDVAGANFTIQGSAGRGSGAGGSIIFQVAPAGSAGTGAQNAYSTALTIASNGKATFAPTVDTTNSFAITNVAGSVIASVDATNRRFNAGGAYGGASFSVSVSTGATTLYDAAYFGWMNGADASSGTTDVRLYRDAANTLALRNGGTVGTPVPQTFNIYNFYTDASNYERLSIKVDVNGVNFSNENAGTGFVRGIRFSCGGLVGWSVSPSRNFLAGADNAYDIGASGATRPRNVYVGTSLTIGTVSVPVTLSASGNSRLLVDSNTVQIGLSTASGVALNRSGTTLQVLLGDVSASAALEALSLKTGAPAGGTSGTWKVGVYNATAPSATGYVEVDIGGTLYKLLAST